MQQSLENQTVQYELIGINNTKGRYVSAAFALNVGGDRANGDILIFLHQDIVFEKEDSLENFVKSIPNEKDYIVGLYGASHLKRRKIKENLYEAETLDECCIAMNTTLWKRLKFNEKICNGWHLYVVELCLRASAQGVLIASGNFDIKHFSSGTVDEKYMNTFKKLLVIYKEKKWIATTCKVMPTNILVFYLYYCLWKIKKSLFGNLPMVYQIKKLLQ